MYLQDQSINKGWARIAEGKALRWRSQKGERKGVKIRFAEKTDEIYRNMREYGDPVMILVTNMSHYRIL